MRRPLRQHKRQLRQPVIVEIQGNRIASINSGEQLPTGASAIDPSSETCLPGLIDTLRMCCFKATPQIAFRRQMLEPSGMSPAAARQGATSQAARLMRLDSTLGVIKPGKLAGIVAVPGNPLDQITVGGKVDFVVEDGGVYRSSQPR